MKVEADRASRAEREQRDMEMRARQEVRDKLQGVRGRLTALVTSNVRPQERGKEFERELTSLFRLSGIQISEPFRTFNEQIDGAIHFDGHTYIVEARWWAEPLEHKDVADLFVKLGTCPPGTRGTYISASRFTNGCVDECTRTKMAAIFVTLEDILLCLETERPLVDMLQRKYQRYSTERQMLAVFRDLF
jgi:hypothetical protein